MSKTYALRVADQNETLALTEGNIDVIAFVVRKLALNESNTYTVELTETEGIGTDVDTRDVLRVTADGELVSLLLGKRLRTERKADKPAEAEPTDEQPEIPADAQELISV